MAGVDTLTEARGPWRDWPPGRLDAWWPEWAQSDTATLPAWFESPCRALVPEQPVDAWTSTDGGSGSSDAPAAEEDPALAELTEAHPELAGLTDDELHDVLDRALAEGSEHPQ